MTLLIFQDRRHSMAEQASIEHSFNVDNCSAFLVVVVTKSRYFGCQPNVMAPAAACFIGGKSVTICYQYQYQHQPRESSVSGI